MNGQQRITITSRYQEYRDLYGSVPALANPNVCPTCLGVKGAGFRECAGCYQASISSYVGTGSAAAFVPLSTAFEPGGAQTGRRGQLVQWYLALREYKRTSAAYASHHEKLTAIVAMGIRQQQAGLEDLLGGTIERVTVVPSSKAQYADVASQTSQPLYRAIRRSTSLSSLLAPTLVHVGDKLRSEVRADAFDCIDQRDIAGKRIVLVDDTWVSGAGATSARQRLVEAGAAAVVIVVAARVVRPSYASDCGADSYLDACVQEHEPGRWPRTVT